MFKVGDRVEILDSVKKELVDLYTKHKGLAGISEKDVNKTFVVESWSGPSVRMHDSNNMKRIHNINKDYIDTITVEDVKKSRELDRRLHEANRLLETLEDEHQPVRKFKDGDKVKFIGSDPNYKNQTGVIVRSKDGDIDTRVGWKSDSDKMKSGYVSTDSSNLELIEVSDKVTEAVDFPSAFNKYKKDLFPDYVDLRAFIRATSDEKWNIQDIESAFYTVDSGREIKKDTTSFTKDPDDYFKYIVKVGGKTKELDDEGCFAELLLFAGKNGNPLKFIVDEEGVYQELVKLED